MNVKNQLVAFAILLMSLLGYHAGAQTKNASATNLSEQLAARDSLLFNAVLNTCNISEVEGLFTPDFMYYQDKGDGKAPGAMPRLEFINNIKRRCARKDASMVVKRVLVKEETLVSELSAAEATQTGIQQFYAGAAGQPGQLIEESHFTRIWRKANGVWQMAREMDYQLNTPSPQDAATTTDLYRQVTKADSLMFAAYNRRDMAAFKSFFAEDLEFYHDKGGLSRYEENMKNFKQHFDDPAFTLRRELVNGSVEVYPLNNYGAVEIGVHRFYARANGKDNLEATAKFINTWHWVNNQWKVTRIISFDHR
jgi:ketosteroid isomerase-like protein